ncbi:MAG TPA: mechanosensitive ion channel domain-containing protein [Candidatus Dormibacteraeota bacterium]|nr:mechanosensitive ion channel domain-containing protein [Candidatus Dormibacteraeota bacterium]
MPTSLQDAWALTSQTVGNVIAGAAVFVLFWLLARLIRNLVSRALARRSIRSDAALLTTRAVYVGVIGLGGFMFVALSLGSGIVGVTGVLIAAVLTSLGLQDLVKNYVSGFYVLMEKNVRVGDLVESGGYRGLVTDIRMRVTYLRGARGEMIVVPNGELFNRTLVVSAAPPDWGSGSDRAQHRTDQGVEVGLDSEIPQTP